MIKKVQANNNKINPHILIRNFGWIFHNIIYTWQFQTESKRKQKKSLSISVFVGHKHIIYEQVSSKCML